MILPELQGQLGIEQDSFFFACDENYFDSYGIPLANSLKKFAPWSNIHIHIFNPRPDQLSWCASKKITASFECVDKTLDNIKTYYACVRFIRIPEIFKNTTKIISLDCDGIVVASISKEKFYNDTIVSKVLWREKQQKSLASSVFFGPDNFRNLYANYLKNYFNDDTFYWYLDQDIMDRMIVNKEVDITISHDWGWPKIKNNTLIWTGKGSRKLEEKFQTEILKFKHV